MRYTLQHPYPSCPFKVGDIIYPGENEEMRTDAGYPMSNGITLGDVLDSIESGSNDFRMLEWWEEVELCDLPRFLRHNGAVFKADHYILPMNRVRPKYGNGFTHTTIHLMHCKPATEQEYQQYLKTING